MSTVTAERASILHSIPGRVRIALPQWSGNGKYAIEIHLRQLQGVYRVQANPVTGNIMITYDPACIDEQTILHAVDTMDLDSLAKHQGTFTSLPSAVQEKEGHTIRMRVAVRGLDRDPGLGKRIVERLESKPGVHAHMNLLTGRVLVEYEEFACDHEDLLTQIAGLELPDLIGNDDFAYPLDPGPLIQSAARAASAALGLGFLAVRRLFGVVDPLPGSAIALNVSSIIGILQGIPFIRLGLRKVFGRTVADLLISLPSTITLALAESPFGLATNEGEALRLMTEVRARRATWKSYEDRIRNAPSAQPDDTIRLENGERTPLAARVIEGFGTASGVDGMPFAVLPGNMLPPGARLSGGSFVLQLQGDQSFQAFTPEPRPAPLALSLYDRYLQFSGLASFLYAGLTAIFTRSFSRTLAALLLVSPRAAMIGQEGATISTSARILRAGGIVVGTRPNRPFRLPQLVMLDGARLLTDRLELAHVLSLKDEQSTNEIQTLVASIANAANSPWGMVFSGVGVQEATDGSFDGSTASATIDGIHYTLGPVKNWSTIPPAAELRQDGYTILILYSDPHEQPLALVALRPHLATGAQELVRVCRKYNVELVLRSIGDQIAVHALAQRAHIALIEPNDIVHLIQDQQRQGRYVAFVSDNIMGSAGFAACDQAIGLTDERSRFPARADVLAFDLETIAAMIEATAYRETAVRETIGLSVLTNVVGAFLGLRGPTGIEMASRIANIGALATLTDGWLRLRGGERSTSKARSFVDPRPERWGNRSVDEVLHSLHTTEDGLSAKQAAERYQRTTSKEHTNRLLNDILDQIRTPLIALMATGAGLSLLFGAVGDVVIIVSTIAISVAVSVWQENKANRVAEALQHMDARAVRVLRDQQPTMVAVNDIAPGDILLLASGDRIAADARIINAQGLEVDESALTGESLPVSKTPDGQKDINHIVLEGSDITSGTGRAIVFAVGDQTRMGATRAALASDKDEASPLGVRLSHMLGVLIPLSIASGVVVVISGLLRGRQLSSLLAVGITVALAAVPEGLPLLAKVGEAGVARRLADQRTVVRRLSSIEALGRVNVACADKTGTMTQGHLQLSLVADINHEASVATKLSAQLQYIVLAAALASPAPDGPDVKSHPTDQAVIQGAIEIGLEPQLYVSHDDEVPFDPVRSFHATRVQDMIYLKGAQEALLPRCRWIRINGKQHPLTERLRQAFSHASLQFTQRGLRILMVAEGNGNTSIDDPQELTALGFVGISDHLRDTVRKAVHRCQNAGVRVIMITGDHPSTARSIAQEAGLLNGEGEVLTASEIVELHNSELDQLLKHAVVIARATPLDKLRIIESLQRQGHTVAMTGDGVNDAPALRLADVGVAMGGGSTEVARQTADVVITNDDFSALVETLVEGRSFWRNIRRALGLLLGGNLGELGLIIGASVLGLGTPLNARQILAMNAITDILPALAIVLQQPEHRNLAELRREGTSALGVPLRNEISRRALATALPTLLAYLIALRSSGPLEAGSIAFASIITTQLAQTLDAGRVESHLTQSVLAAVGGSLGILVATFSIPFLRNFFSLIIPSPMGWLLLGAGTISAVLLSHLLSHLPLENLDLRPRSSATPSQLNTTVSG